MDNYLETVKKKREQALKGRAKLNAQKEVVDTTKNSSAAVAATIARENALNRANTQKVSVTNNVATSDDIQKVIAELKETQLASYLSGQNKGSVILADSTDLGERVSELGDKMADAIAAIESNTSQEEALSNIAKEYRELAKSVQEAAQANSRSIVDAIQKLEGVFKSIQITPKVSVQAPNVNVPKVDLSGVQSAIESLKEEESKSEFSLNDYTAQDIDSSNPGFQYVGMVKPDGCWCIIENDIEGNSLRFALGEGNYQAAWEKHMAVVYKRLDEAINGIPA